MEKLKYSLISLLAVCLTAGGVFAAWSFSEGDLEQLEEVTVNVSTEGLGGMEFTHVNVRFDANGGSYSDDTTIKTLLCKKHQSISSDTYNTLFANFSCFPTKKVGNETYYFSNWSTSPKGTDYFSFDNGIEEDCTYYAQYSPSSNPAIYKSTDLNNPLGYFKLNSGTEYYMRNFVATGMKNHSNNNRGFHYVIKYEDMLYNILSSKSFTNNKYNYSFDQNKDYLVDGLYNIYFDKNKNADNELNDDSGTIGWVLYGGKALFEPQYNYRLVGNPVASDNENGWKDPSPNPISFKYDSTSNNGLTKTYIIDRVDFPFYDGETRDFKPYIANFGIYPLKSYHNSETDKLYPLMIAANDDVTKEHLSYTGNDNGANLLITNDTILTYKVTMTVNYENRQPFLTTYANGTSETYFSFTNYPISMTVALEPYEHNIYIHNSKNDSEFTRIPVLSNQKWENYENCFPTKVDNTLPISKVIKGYAWKDYYTDSIIDFENLKVNKSYHVYPDYKEVEAEKVTFNLNVFIETYKNIPIPMYKGHTIARNIRYYLEEENDNVFDEILRKHLSNDDAYTVESSNEYGSNCIYNFDGYVTSLSDTSKLNFTNDILNKTLNGDFTIYARYRTEERILKYKDNSTNEYLYKYPADTTTYPEKSEYLNVEPSKEAGHILEINENKTDFGYRLMSYNDFDPINPEKESYNFTYGSGRYWPIYNTSDNTWSFKMLIVYKGPTWWLNDFDNGSYNYAYAWDGIGNNEWTKLIFKKDNHNGRDECFFLISTSMTDIIFSRNKTDEGNFGDNDSNIHNKTSDMSLVNYSVNNFYLEYLF